MADLSTTYLGLALRNPIIAGASDLTSTVDGIKGIEQAGAGAIVLKSLFEEQIQLERLRLEEDLQVGQARYAEMVTIFPNLQHAGPKEHLLRLRRAKAAVQVPVIASLNAVSRSTWVEYSKAFADEGADALELNFFASPRDREIPGATIEEEQLDIVREIRAAVRVPIAVKLSVFYSNPLNFVSRLDGAGVRGLVLFNRFFQPDIDVEREAISMPFNFSSQHDNRLPLRYAGLLYGRVKADVCASTGIMTGIDVVKMLLAGAAAVQVVTTLYRHRVTVIERMLEQVSSWMDRKGHARMSEVRGILSAERAEDSWAYTRAQYARMLLNPKEFMEEIRA